jgi:chromosome segregation ATPase
MQGIQAIPTMPRENEQSTRAFASKNPKAFLRPSMEDLMQSSLMKFNLDDDSPEMSMATRVPDDKVTPGRMSGLTSKPRSKSEMGHREPSLLRGDWRNDRDMPGDAPANFSKSSVQLPELHCTSNLPVRSSVEGRPSKTEGGSRKSVLWALDDAAPRAITAAAPRLEGCLRSSVDIGMPSRGTNVVDETGGGIPGSAAAQDDLQTQLNLLRERSWSEQQSLRRQLDDQKADRDKIKKELESANVLIQQLQNENASIKETFDVAAAVEKNGSATELIEEKNAQIRHLENLARELASSGGQGISLQAPSRELASGGGTMGSVTSSVLKNPSQRERQLQEELKALQLQREKEKDDLKDLEKVVEVFEAKMEALKRENKDLKRQAADIKSSYAQSLAMQPQMSASTHHHTFHPDKTSNSTRLERMIENMSILMCSLHDRNSALGSLIGSLSRWKLATKGAQPKEDDDGRSSRADQITSLKFQLRGAENKIAELKEEMENMMTRHTNLMESEQAQTAMMAQRLLKSEDSVTEKDKEISKLKSEVSKLELELDSSQRRLASTSAMVSTGDQDNNEDQSNAINALEDDIASLKIVRTSLNNKMAVMRKMGAVKAVRDRDRSCLLNKFHAWRIVPVLDKHIPVVVFQSNRARNTMLKLKVFQKWFEQSCLIGKAELQTTELDSQKQIDHLKTKLTAEREAANSLISSHKEVSARCEDLTQEISHLKMQQQSIMRDFDSGVAGKRQVEKLQPNIRGIIDGVGKVKDEMDVLTTVFQCAVSENQGLRESIARLSTERDSWFEERARIHERQAAAGGSTSDANASLTRDRLRIVTNKLDASMLEVSALRSSMVDAKELADDLQALVFELQSKGHVLLRRGSLNWGKYDGMAESHPLAKARMLAGEVRTFFNNMWQTFTDEGSTLSPDTHHLHVKIQDLMKHLSDTNNELQNCKLEAKQQVEVRQHEIAMLSSSLTLTKNEVNYLQEIADGGNAQDIYKRSIKSIEHFITSLNKKYSKKVAEFQGLERQLTVLTRSNIEKSTALESAKRQLLRFQNVGHDAMSAVCTPEQELQMQLQERDRDLEIAREKMQHSMDSSDALASEVRELTTLWRASAAEVFFLNDSIAKCNAETQGLRIFSDTTKAQLKELEDENRKLYLQVEVANKSSDAQSEQLAASQEQTSGLSRQVTEATEANSALEGRVSQLQGTMKVIEEKYAQELKAREKAEEQLRKSVTAFESDGVSLRSKFASKQKVFESTAVGLRSICAAMQQSIQAVAVCIGEQQDSQILVTSQVQGASTNNETLKRHLQDCQVALQSSQDESNQLKQDLAAMRKETDDLQDQLHGQSGQNLSLTKEVRKLTTLKENLETEMKKLIDVKELLTNEIADLKGRLESSVMKHEEEADELRGQISKQGELMATQQKELAEEKQRLAAADHKAQQLERDLASAKSKYDNANSMNEELSHKLASLREESKLQKVEFEANSFRFSESEKQQASKLSQAHLELEKVEDENRVLKLRIESLGTELTSAQQELSQVIAEKTELQDNLNSESNQKHAWLTKAKDLERTLSSKDDELTRMRDAAERSEASRREAEVSMQTLQSKAGETLKSFEATVDKERQEKAKIESERMYLKERVQQLKAQLEKAQVHVDEREEMINVVQKQSFMLQVQLLESLELVKARDATISASETYLVKFMQSCENNRCEMDRMQHIIDKCRAEMDEKSLQLEKSKDKCAEYEQHLREAIHTHKQELNKKDATIETERQEIDSLRERIQELEGVRDSAQTRESELATSLEGEKAKSAELQESLSQQSSLNSQLEESINASREEMATREKELQSCTLRLAEAGRVMEAFHGEKEKFRLKCLDLQRELDAATSNLIEKESDFVELEGKIEHQNRALEESKGVYNDLKNKYSMKQEEIEDLQCELTKVGAQLATANQEVERQKILHSKQLEEFDTLRQALSNQAALVTEAEEKVESLHEEMRLKESTALDLVASLEQQVADLGSKLSEKEEELNDAQGKQAKVMLQYDTLKTRCLELDEENSRTTSKLNEYDSILQAKGKELARMHGALAEARSLAEDAEMRVQNVKELEEKLKREVASKDKQLKSLQQGLLDGSIASLDGSIVHEPENVENNRQIAALEKEYSQLQECLHSSQEQCAALQREIDTGKDEATDLRERLQNTELQVVSLKLEIESKQSDLDEMCGKVARLEQALAVKQDTDDVVSKATTARVTPTRGFKATSEGNVQGDINDHKDVSELMQQLAATQKELETLKGELAACRNKLKEKAQMDMARLTVRCHKSVLRREEELERQEDLENRLASSKEAMRNELCDLQQQLVEKSNLLLASEKKFAQLLAWTQKNKAAVT